MMNDSVDQNFQLAPLTYAPLLNSILLAAYRGPDFPCRLRLLRWLEAIVGPKRIIAPVEGQLRFSLDHRDWVQRSLLYQGVYEPEVARHIRTSLAPGDIFLDAGAQVGWMSLVAASSGARVFAVEPDPLACNILASNLSLNVPISSAVTILQMALGDAIGIREFGRSHVSNTGLSALGLQGAVCQFDVSVATIDSLVHDAVLPPPTAIKIDVEGGELALLEGAKSAFASHPPRWVIIELEPEGESFDQAHAWFTSRHYSISRVPRDSGMIEARENYLATFNG